MGKELVKTGGSAPSKEKIAAFVHDMKEIEAKQFALLRTNIKTHDERKRIESKVDHNLNSAQYSYAKAERELQAALKNRKEKPKEVYEPKKVREPLSYFSRFGVLFLILYVELPAIILDRFKVSFSSREELYICACLLIIAGILVYIMNRMFATRRYDNYLCKYKKYKQYQTSLSEYERQEAIIQARQKDFIVARKTLSDAQKEKADSVQQVAKLDEMNAFLTQHISKIEDEKQKLYALNIVPPDYRELDCMIEFDQIFRNDLADTMREAVKIYEERVFRGEVIRGIDKIYTMLGELVSTMRNIESALYSIQSEVRLMSDDLFKITSDYEKSQENLLSETRAARYATEALQKTQERCEWYMNRSYWNT